MRRNSKRRKNYVRSGSAAGSQTAERAGAGVTAIDTAVAGVQLAAAASSAALRRISMAPGEFVDSAPALDDNTYAMTQMRDEIDEVRCSTMAAGGSKLVAMYEAGMT